MLVNPYIAGNPVGGSEAFVGRTDILRTVLRVLKNPGENAIVLYGQRRIGKTSVLLELMQHLPQEGPYQPIYFDLQDKAALPLSTVLRELMQRMISATGVSAPTLTTDDLPEEFQTNFLTTVLQQLPAETSLVLLFDEFDVLDNPGEGQAGRDFFPYLRNLLTVNPRLQFAFVIGRRPEDLSSFTLSIFKGIKAERISLLTATDTAALVRLSEQNGSLRWAEEAIDRVYALAGGHPFLTQQLCQELWETAWQDDPDEPPLITLAAVDAAIDPTLRSATNALEWLWDGLRPAQRIVAAALAEAGPDTISQEELESRLQQSGVRILIGELQDAPRTLQDWDLLEPGREGYRFRVELLRRWIVQNKPLARVQQEIDFVQPAAENLFQAAYAFYQAGQLAQALPLLRQVVTLNPNHVRGALVLSEILLAQNEVDEARQLLENLYQYLPVAVQSRLVQVLLTKAKATVDDVQRIELYNQVLRISPGQTEAQTALLQLSADQATHVDKVRERSNLDEGLKGEIFTFRQLPTQQSIIANTEDIGKINEHDEQSQGNPPISHNPFYYGLPVPTQQSIIANTEDIGKINEHDEQSQGNPPISHNPFDYGPPVAPGNFIGRQQSLNLIIERILRGKTSTAVIGEPRMGKTSLLYYLESATTRNKLYGAEANKLIFSFFDLSMLSNEPTPAAFWQYTLQPVFDLLSESALMQYLQECKNTNYDTFALDRLLQQIGNMGYRLVLLLDEFDILVRFSTETKSNFLKNLCSLASRRSNVLLLVAACRSSLNKVSSSADIPSLKIFEPIPIGAFSEREIEILLDRAQSKFTQNDRRYILYLAGGHPYLLQATASAMWDAYALGLQDFSERQDYVFRRLYYEHEHYFADVRQFWTLHTHHAFACVALSNAKGLLGQREFQLSALLNNITEWGPELKQLEYAGILARHPEVFSDWQVRSTIMIAWFTDELTRIVRDETELAHWLSLVELEGRLIRNQRKQITETWRRLLSYSADLIQKVAMGFDAAPSDNVLSYLPPIPTTYFIGRQSVLRQVVRRILNQGQSTALVGEPRLGKTSLLHYLETPQTRTALYGARADSLHFAYLDGQTLSSGCTLTQFWELALRTLKADAAPTTTIAQQYAQSAVTGHNVFALELLFQTLHATGQQLVLLIDEFDRMIHHPLLGRAEFFGSLRSLASRSQGAFTLIIASRLSLTRLNTETQPYNPTGSPFFNIFAEITLGTLNQQEIDQLLNLAGENFTPNDRSFIQGLAGGHPYLLQATSAAMLEAYTEELMDPESRYRYVLEALRRNQYHHFADTWRAWSPPVRQAFTAVALLNTNAAALPTFAINLAGFRERLPELLPELNALELIGVVRRIDGTVDGWQVAQGVLLTWLWDELIREIRDETALGLWLRGADLERRWTEGQRQQFWELFTQVRQAYPNTAITLINTAGGTFIGGNVSAGSNFVSRDLHSGAIPPA